MFAWIIEKNQGDRIKFVINSILDLSQLALGVGELRVAYILAGSSYKASILLKAGWAAYDALSGIADVVSPVFIKKIEDAYCRIDPVNQTKCNEMKSFIASVESAKTILDITSLGGHGIQGLIDLVGNWRKVKTSIKSKFPNDFNQIDDKIEGTQGIVKKCESEGACFIAGTLISTPSGYKPIEQIKTGDLVLSKDPASGNEEYKTVKQTYIRHTNTLVRIIAQKDTIFATPEHPFWVNNRWVEAAKIKTGDKLTLATTADFTATNTPQSLPYLARSSIEAEQVLHINTKATVYNFEVEGFHTYFVGKQAVWVHNADYWDGIGKSFDELKLGGLIGEGGNKEVFEIIGEPDKIIAVLKIGKPLNALDKEIELLRKLSDNNLPVVEIIEKGLIEGRAAVVMKKYAQGSKDVVKRVGDKMEIVGTSQYLNQKSVNDLSKIKRQLIDQKISIDDLQFLIGKDGSIVIADPLAVYLNVAPSKWNIKMIDKLIEAVN